MRNKGNTMNLDDIELFELTTNTWFNNSKTVWKKDHLLDELFSNLTNGKTTLNYNKKRKPKVKTNFIDVDGRTHYTTRCWCGHDQDGIIYLPKSA